MVDTGFWIFGKKRMLPAGVVRAIDVDEKKVFVAMTKDEIKGAPDYDDEHHQRDEPGYHDEVGRYYDPWGGTPPMEGRVSRRACYAQSAASRVGSGSTLVPFGPPRRSSKCRWLKPFALPVWFTVLDHVAGLDRSRRVLERTTRTR